MVGMIAELTIEYAEAKRAVDGMIAELERRGKAAVVVVADSHGELILLARMDGAPRWLGGRKRPTRDGRHQSRHRGSGSDHRVEAKPRRTG
jgi:D-aminopeptidase